MKKILFIGTIGIVLIVLGFASDDLITPKSADENIVSVNIPEGITFSKLMEQLNIPTSVAAAILESAKPVYDLSTIVSGHKLALVLANADSSLRRLVYNIDSDRQLVVVQESLGEGVAAATTTYKAEVRPIDYEVEINQLSGTVNTSLYEYFTANGEDVRLALSLAEMFAWQVDFAADIRTGDSFKVLYEKRFLDDNYIMPGRVLAAEFINDNQRYQAFYFESEKTKANYYDENGNSLQKQFLKSPLQYKYISSGFSYARVNPITKKTSAHRGIDYAANHGTPAVTVGDGTVTQAGWNGYYGISVTIRHNDTYRTVYGHFSSLAKGIRTGAKVKQGQVIGYVGSTGQSTGPHLHYEMHKFNSYVNPFTVEIPPGDPIAEIDGAAFNEARAEFLDKLE